MIFSKYSSILRNICSRDPNGGNTTINKKKSRMIFIWKFSQFEYEIHGLHVVRDPIDFKDEKNIASYYDGFLRIFVPISKNCKHLTLHHASIQMRNERNTRSGQFCGGDCGVWGSTVTCNIHFVLLSLTWQFDRALSLPPKYHLNLNQIIYVLSVAIWHRPRFPFSFPSSMSMPEFIRTSDDNNRELTAH